MGFLAGIDWGSVEHAVCVIDDAGRVITRFGVPHSEAGIRDLLRKLRKICPLEQLRLAIERPSGLLVDGLLEAGCRVVPIHPNVVKACRPRYRAAGGKDDVGDAYILADILRTDGHRFRDLVPFSDELRPCELSCERAMTSSRRAWPSPTNSELCSIASGRALRASSRRSIPRSPSPF
jgi:hypothetical protein